VSGKITVTFTKFFDGHDRLEQNVDTGDDEGRIDVDKKFWLGKRPESIIRVADSLVKIFQSADRHLRVTYLQQFWGFALGEKPKNFATIAPKQKFVNVRARIRDTETWSKRLTRAGFEVTGGHAWKKRAFSRQGCAEGKRSQLATSVR
jgi:hypothetical protein